MTQKISDLASFKQRNSFIILGIAHRLDIHRNNIFRPYGITGKQASILIFLFFNAHRDITQRDIEQEFSLRPSTINSVLNNLEEGGFLARSVSAADGRAKIVRPTPKGQQLFEQILANMQMQEDMITQGFSPDELALLQAFLRRIMRNILSSQEGNT